MNEDIDANKLTNCAKSLIVLLNSFDYTEEEKSYIASAVGCYFTFEQSKGQVERKSETMGNIYTILLSKMKKEQI